jgi:hypothetical protein
MRKQTAHKNNKLEKMIAAKDPHCLSPPVENVINPSKVTLTRPHINVLARGMNFSVAPARVPLIDFITPVEAAARRFAPETAALCKTKIHTQLIKHHRLHPNLTPAEAEGLTELRKNKDVMILKADKGGAAILMDTTDYNTKMDDLLSGPVYEQLPGKPFREHEKELTKLCETTRGVRHPGRRETQDHPGGELQALDGVCVQSAVHLRTPESSQGGHPAAVDREHHRLGRTAARALPHQHTTAQR